MDSLYKVKMETVYLNFHLFKTPNSIMVVIDSANPIWSGREIVENIKSGNIIILN